MIVNFGDITISGYVPGTDMAKVIEQITSALESTVYSRDSYNTYGYDMTHVTITIHKTC